MPLVRRPIAALRAARDSAQGACGGNQQHVGQAACAAKVIPTERILVFDKAERMQGERMAKAHENIRKQRN
jgi:hypothetical protein